MNKFIVTLRWPHGIGRQRRYNVEKLEQTHQQQQQHDHHHPHPHHHHHHHRKKHQKVSGLGVTLWTTIAATIGLVIFLLCIEIDHNTVEHNNLHKRHHQIISASVVYAHGMDTPRAESGSKTIVKITPDVRHHWPGLASYLAETISGVSLSIASVGRIVLFTGYWYTEYRIFFGLDEKCSVLPLRFSLGILILVLVQAPPAVHSLGKHPDLTM